MLCLWCVLEQSFVGLFMCGVLLGCSGDACCWCEMRVCDGVLEIGYGDTCGV